MFDFIVADLIAGGFNESGINGNVLSLSFKLAKDFGIDLIHSIFGKPGSKKGESWVIRRSFTEKQAQEFFKRQSVVDLILQFDIGIDMKPLLEEQALTEK